MHVIHKYPNIHKEIETRKHMENVVLSTLCEYSVCINTGTFSGKYYVTSGA